MIKIIVFIVVFLSMISSSIAKDIIILEVNNPYSLTVNLKVKCDYDYNKKEFMFQRLISVKGKSNMLISLPAGLKRCQIWPKIKWW